MPLAPRSLTIFESFHRELQEGIAETQAENQAIRERIAQAQAQQSDETKTRPEQNRPDQTRPDQMVVAILVTCT